MKKSKIAFAVALMVSGHSVSYAQQVFEEISVVLFRSINIFATAYKAKGRIAQLDRAPAF